jgi:uncharacterized OB-fold protein
MYSDHCHHVWLYYDMRVRRCRKQGSLRYPQRRACHRLEDKAVYYSLRAAGI